MAGKITINLKELH